MIRAVPVDAAAGWLPRPRVLIYSGPLALSVTTTAAIFAAVFAVGPGFFGAWVGFFAALASSLPWWRRYRNVTRVHNAAVTALREGDHAGAGRTFRDVLRFAAPRSIAASALANLGHLAMLDGDFAASESLLRAAATALGARRATLEDQTRQYVETRHAIALARLGRLDEADAALARVEPDMLESHANYALARAFVDFQRGRHDAVVERLENARPLVTRVFTGESAMLAVALDAMAVRRLNGIYRGTARRAAVLPCSDAVRASVERMLPGASEVLPGADEAAA